MFHPACHLQDSVFSFKDSEDGGIAVYGIGLPSFSSCDTGHRHWPPSDGTGWTVYSGRYGALVPRPLYIRHSMTWDCGGSDSPVW